MVQPLPGDLPSDHWTGGIQKIQKKNKTLDSQPGEHNKLRFVLKEDTTLVLVFRSSRRTMFGEQADLRLDSSG